MKEPRLKKPLLAVLLTFVVPGLGHVYAGKYLRGVVLFFANTLIVGIGAHYLVDPKVFIGGGHLVGFVLIASIFGVWISVDAYFWAKRHNEANHFIDKPSVTKVMFFIVAAFFLYILNVHFVRGNVVQAFRVPTATMDPTIKRGDRILVNKIIYKFSAPQRGDVIVFKYPQDTKRVFVKRLIAVGGDTVTIKEGKVFVNDKIFGNSSADNIKYQNQGNYGQAGMKLRVPQGEYFVLGDNTAQSMDSRYWGFVPASHVQGKAVKIYYPLERTGIIK
jgi:signal peptidase I